MEDTQAPTPHEPQNEQAPATPAPFNPADIYPTPLSSAERQLSHNATAAQNESAKTTKTEYMLGLLAVAVILAMAIPGIILFLPIIIFGILGGKSALRDSRSTGPQNVIVQGLRVIGGVIVSIFIFFAICIALFIGGLATGTVKVHLD